MPATVSSQCALLTLRCILELTQEPNFRTVYISIPFNTVSSYCCSVCRCKVAISCLVRPQCSLTSSGTTSEYLGRSASLIRSVLCPFEYAAGTTRISHKHLMPLEKSCHVKQTAIPRPLARSNNNSGSSSHPRHPRGGCPPARTTCRLNEEGGWGKWLALLRWPITQQFLTQYLTRRES